MCVCIHEFRYPHVPEDGVAGAGVTVTAGHELPNTGGFVFAFVFFHLRNWSCSFLRPKGTGKDRR